MSASYTTGTAPGVGSAEPNNKGSERMSMGVEKLIGSRVVMAGSVALTSGTPSVATVTFPVVLDSVAGHYVIATPVGSTTAIALAGCSVHSLTTAGFQIAGGSSVTTTINWMLVKA